MFKCMTVPISLGELGDFEAIVDFSHSHDKEGYRIIIIEIVANGVDILSIARPDRLIKDTTDFIINALSSE